MKIFLSIVKFVVVVVGEYLYYIAMIKRLYFIKTDSQAFQCIKKRHKHRQSKYLNAENVPEDLDNSDFKNRVRSHIPIHVSTLDKLLLFLTLNCPCLGVQKMWAKSSKMMRLFREGRSKI